MKKEFINNVEVSDVFVYTNNLYLHMDSRREILEQMSPWPQVVP
jgi:hypothetical protein